MSKVTKARAVNKRQISERFTRVRNHMLVNVILTFNAPNKYGDWQEMFDVSIPVSQTDTDAVSFVLSKLFKKIENKCTQLARRKQEIIKISTAAEWGIFESVTHKKSLPALGHIGKWDFGFGRERLDIMERCAIAEYQFGTDAYLSSNDQWLHDHMAKVLAPRTKNLQHNSD